MSNSNWNILVWEYFFYAPYWLLLLLLIPFIYMLLIKTDRRNRSGFKYTGSLSQQLDLEDRRIYRIRQLIRFAWVFVYTMLVIALARPYNVIQNEDINEQYKNGIDIIIAMDISGSMLAMDFKPNRLEAAKEVAKEFVEGRNADRIGLVVYSGEAYTACPATLDHDVLLQQIEAVGSVELEPGTAIGTGLGTAVTRLRSDELKSKVIILLTDGSNNAGNLDPISAAELAKAKNVRVYTIGVGSNGEAPTPVVTPFGIRYENMPVEIDEVTLTNIAKLTDGAYFRATDKESLSSIYEEIEKLEKQRLLEKNYYNDIPATPQGFLKWGVLIAILTWTVQLILFKREE